MQHDKTRNQVLDDRYLKNIKNVAIGEFIFGLLFLFSATISAIAKTDNKTFFGLIGALVFIFLKIFVTLIAINCNDKLFYSYGAFLEKLRTTLFCLSNEDDENKKLLAELYSLQSRSI